MSCYCDFDPARVLDRQERTARITHRCCECSGLIRPGERYEDVRALWEDSSGWERYRTCAPCVEARAYMTRVTSCDCWTFHGLWEELSNSLDLLCYQPGERFGLLRRLVLMERRGREARRELAA